MELTRYPKDPTKNLEWRRAILLKARDDMEFRAKVIELFHRDILFAFNAFFYTLDPRKRPLHHQPFCTYPFQDKSILQLQEAIQKGEDRVIEKSRDMGWSWMVINTFIHFWLDPKGGSDFLLGSRIEDYVDKKGDMRTLMEKARYTLYRLPKWLRPQGFNRKQHDNFMRLVNPITGASITGESNNPNWSTGGRYLAGLLDEFAKWEGSDKSAWTAAGDATRCRLALSTPFGAGGQYYELAHDPSIEKIVTHWSLHPEKRQGLYCVWPKPEEAGEIVDEQHWIGLRSPWYDKQCKRRKPSEIKQELDISYIGSGTPVFEGKALNRIEQLLKTQRKPVGYYKHVDGTTSLELAKADESLEGLIIVYENPNPAFSYVVAADVVEGKEDGDYAVAKVLRRDSEDVVASYYSQIDEVRLGSVIVAMTLFYTTYVPDRNNNKKRKSPWWAVETIGPGLSTFDYIVENYQLPNAFMMPQGFDQVTQRPSFKKGWWTSTTSKHALIGGIKTWLLKGTSWCDLRCAKEMTTFVRGKTGKAGAKPGCHDDEVMCLGIALQVNEIVPLLADEIPIERMDNGLPVEVFKPKRIEEPKSLQERCLEDLMEKRQLRQNEDGLDEAYIIPQYGMMEDLGLFD